MLGRAGLFTALLALLVTRLLIAESYEPLNLPFLDPSVLAIGPTPASTVALDSLLMLLSVVTLAGVRRRWAGWLAPTAVICLLLAVAISSTFALKPRLALNAGAGLLAAALAACALAQLADRRWMTRLLLSAVLAAGGANALKCVLQRTIEFEEVRQGWEQRKQALLAQGVSLSDPSIVNFERRLNSLAVMGYLGHPNVAGGCLAACVVLTIGLALAVPRRATAAQSDAASVHPILALGVAAALLALLGSGLWLTDSLGALLAAAAGVVTLLLMLTAAACRASARTLFALVAGGYGAIILCGAVYGTLRGSLPHESLAFRWDYWQAAFRALPEKPLTGVGRLNFLAAYLRHKAPAATEEVRDPHNLWVSLLVELGPLGLLAGALLAAAALRSALRSGPASTSLSEPGANDPPAFICALAAGLATLLAYTLLSNMPLDAVGLALPLLLALVGLSAAFEAVPPTAAADRALRLALAGAMAALLLHSLVDFTLLTPAGAALMAALAGCAAAQPHDAGMTAAAAPQPPAPCPGYVRAAGLLLVPAAHVVLCSMPTSRAEARLADWQRQLTGTLAAPPVPAVDSLIRSGWDAVRADPWDDRPPRIIGRTLLGLAAAPSVSPQVASESLRAAEAFARAAVARCPSETAAQQVLIDVLMARRERAVAGGDDRVARALLDEALGHVETLVSLYPSDPRARLSAAQAWALRWRAARESDAARMVSEHLHAALRIDAARKPDVAVKLSAVERAMIAALLAEVEPARE
ncbi:MAG: O-antigen ligase family protein [Phycisphaerae bacterium]|nr:O-antigen ligase family protein [Phycisphaerae bacterium]MCZ2399019.1 O-antigen ligase family protein [Phycisphaerae bacterium]